VGGESNFAFGRIDDDGGDGIFDNFIRRCCFPPPLSLFESLLLLLLLLLLSEKNSSSYSSTSKLVFVFDNARLINAALPPLTK
jgi:hypothetical protein